MEKTVTIGDKEVRLSNNVSWAMIYHDQFGHDIIPTLTPLVAAAFDIISGLVDKNGAINTADILRKVDGDTFIEAVIHLSGLEFIEFINIVWSMAKVVDDSIPEPKIWVRQFDTFELDTLVPAVAALIVKGLTSSKNWERLTSLKEKVSQPLI